MMNRLKNFLKWVWKHNQPFDEKISAVFMLLMFVIVALFVTAFLIGGIIAFLYHAKLLVCAFALISICIIAWAVYDYSKDSEEN